MDSKSAKSSPSRGPKKSGEFNCGFFCASLSLCSAFYGLPVDDTGSVLSEVLCA